MAVPNSMADLATLAGSNSPAGSEAIGNSLDNYLRAHAAIIRSTNALASATIAAASTTDIGAADAESVQVIGSATITSFGNGFPGAKREVRFNAACTLTHSGNLVLPNGANVVTANTDVFSFRCFGTGQWVLTAAQRPVTQAPDAAKLGGVTPSAFILTLLDDANQAAACATLGAVAKAGDTMTGNLTVPQILTDVISPTGTTGAQQVWGIATPGDGRTEYINNRGSGGGGFAWYNRADTGAGLGSALAYLNPSGNLSTTGGFTSPGALTVGGGSPLSKITVSNAAPGALTAGELYLRY